MIAFLLSPADIRHNLAQRAQARRLALNITQKELAARSGVSLASLRRFENDGDISLESLMALALVLDDLEGFNHLFLPREQADLFAPPPTKRKRARSKS